MERVADRTILDGDYAFGELDIVIVMGRVEDIESFRSEYGV